MTVSADIFTRCSSHHVGMQVLSRRIYNNIIIKRDNTKIAGYASQDVEPSSLSVGMNTGSKRFERTKGYTGM